MMKSSRQIDAKDFEFVSDGLLLAGTIERPAQEAPAGSILLLSGSGPQDRDETIAGQKPFSVLSSALATWGYQVFRWDDRGVGDSEGDYLSASGEDLVDDVVSAMSAIEQDSGFDEHVLVGHSQGALIAASVAVTRPASVSGLVILAGMGQPGRQALLDQHVNICEAEGCPDHDIRQSLAQKEALFDMLVEAQSKIDAGEPEAKVLSHLSSALWSAFLGDADASDLSRDERRKLESTIEDLLEWEWRYLLGVDPSVNLQEVTCPVLAVAGDADAQVCAERDLAIIERACDQGKAPSVQIQLIADHNHLFQETTNAAPSSYETLGTPFSRDVLSIIRFWLRNT